jgi:hypothetical protein
VAGIGRAGFPRDIKTLHWSGVAGPRNPYSHIDRKAEGSGGWVARIFCFEHQRAELDKGQALNRSPWRALNQATLKFSKLVLPGRIQMVFFTLYIVEKV